MHLHLLKFIKENENWLELITADPYNITVKDDGKFVLFMYSQISSDFKIPLVRECRGIILRKSDLEVVCMPFTKFFNIQETNVAKIDWNSARVQEKVDGSIIKVWYDYETGWHVSTNGTIDAHDASLQMPVSGIENYYDLFMSAENLPSNFFEMLDVNFTYIFELVSPFNRVVVPYSRTLIYHTGTRYMSNLKEADVDLGIQKPNSYPMQTLEDCMLVLEDMGFDEEGFVVVDGNWNRCKIKSAAYVAAHHLKNNGVVTLDRVLEMIKTNESDEFLGYFPEYKVYFDELDALIVSFIGSVEKFFEEIPMERLDRKDFANLVKRSTCPSFFFQWYDGKVGSVREWFWKQSNEHILKMLGK